MDASHFQRVTEFYDRFHALNSNADGRVFCAHPDFVMSDPNKMCLNPLAEGKLVIYHNSARVSHSDVVHILLHHGDVIKVGPSLMFGYLHLTEPFLKQARKAQDQGSPDRSSALSSAVERGVTRR